MGDIQLINGSWQQTIAYLIQQLNIDVNNSFSAITGDTNIVIEEFIPNSNSIYCINVIDEPLKHQPITVKLIKKQLPPQIKTINLTRSAAHLRVCGPSSNNQKYIDCANCLNKWLAENQNYQLKDLTGTKTGCNVWKPCF